jgi:hypothetical protein
LRGRRGAGARLGIAAAVGALALTCAAVPARATFPYTGTSGNPHDFTDLYLGNETPDDLGGDGNTFKYAATPDSSNGPQINNSAVELNGVRGAHLADATDAPTTAVEVTLGRPDVTIAVMDSGIKWNDAGAMADLRNKIRINKDELPAPETAPGTPCSTPATDPYDCDDNGVVTVDDYASDYRVDLSDPRRAGPSGVLVPQDLLIAFSDGSDADSNGFVDDIAGWDFLDNDNDAFDDVQYGHGTGEAVDSSAEADNGAAGGDTMGSCSNCRVIPMRVGDSFVADVNRFAQGTIYAADNNVQVVQSALGTLNNSTLARQAVDYAYSHGTTAVLSAADEAAQHNNQPYLPHAILVNSVRDGLVPAPNKSYLAFNGCTNFNAKITLAIPSTSCSSNAVGLAAGMAGLVYSAAYTAKQKGVLESFPDTSLCELNRPNPDTGATK